MIKSRLDEIETSNDCCPKCGCPKDICCGQNKVPLEWLEEWANEQIRKFGLKGRSKAIKNHNDLVAVYVKDLFLAVKRRLESDG